jgi:transposase
VAQGGDLELPDDLRVAKGFRPVDRDQQFLLAPDMREWLPGDHLVWFVLDAVTGLDLGVFRERRRLGGAGRAAYDPAMMVSLLVYAYAHGQRSSRQIERLCQTDVAFRIVCAQDVPDHATIARFRAEQEQGLGELFGQVLGLCARAGMGRLGTVALDGTKIAANAALRANRSESRLRQLAAEILAEAGSVDAEEDAQFGDARGDELPPELADPSGRAERIKNMLADIAAERAARAGGRTRQQRRQRAERAGERAEQAAQRLERTRARIAAQAAQRAEREAAAAAAGTTIPGTRPVPVDEHCQVRTAAQRLARAQAARHAVKDPPPPPPGSPAEAKRNLTDPDSRIMTNRGGWIQAYNGQLVVSADHLILAADLSNSPTDVGHYQPMIDQATRAARTIGQLTGRPARIGCVLADAGYASNDNLTAPGPERLIALGTRRDHDTAATADPARGRPSETATARERMDHRLRTPAGAARYRQRAATVEPVHAHIKDRRGLRRFARRGLAAAHSEFRFAATVTNLLRLHAHLATTPA